jgi:hypothetical protein
MSILGRELYMPARLTSISLAAHASLIQIVGLLLRVSLVTYILGVQHAFQAKT